MALLRHLDPAEAEYFASGEEEVREMLEDLGIARAGARRPEPPSAA